MSTTTPIDLHDPVSPELRRLMGEPPLSLAEAARQLGVTYKAVLALVQKGKRGVRLEAYELVGGLTTSKEALARFAAAVTARRLGAGAPEKPLSQAERERRAAKATEELYRLRGKRRRQ